MLLVALILNNLIWKLASGYCVIFVMLAVFLDYKIGTYSAFNSNIIMEAKNNWFGILATIHEC